MSGELKDSDRMEQIMQPFRVYDTEVLKRMYFRVYANVPEKREAIYIYNIDHGKVSFAA